MTDFTILYAIVALIVILAVGITAKRVKDKDILDEDDLEEFSLNLGVTMSILRTMNLKKESELNKVYEVISLTISYIMESMDEITKEEAIEYLLGVCELVGLKLDKEKSEVLMQVLEISLLKFNKILK